MCCKYKNIVHRHILYVAKTYIICCKDIYYMLQRQNLYVAKKTYMLQRQIHMLQRQNLYVIKTNLYVIKTKFICYKDKCICYKDKIYML